MYGIIRKIRLFGLSFDIQLDLFDKIVLPVLLYSCEIWGQENIDVIERVDLRFLKHILNLKSSTPNVMVYGETGRFPLYITIYTRMVGFGATMILCHENKLCKCMYMYLFNCYTRSRGEMNNTCNWLFCIKKKKHLYKCDLSYIWHQQNAIDVKWLESIVNQNLKDPFIQNGMLNSIFLQKVLYIVH